jgi:hypothetical protein
VYSSLTRRSPWGIRKCYRQLEDNVCTLMRHPLVVVGSDGNALAPRGLLGQRKPHPRRYVRRGHTGPSRYKYVAPP